MPKMKTRRAAAKRFSVTKSGKIKRFRTGKRHMLNGKTRKLKRRLRTGTYVDQTFEKTVREMIPFK